MNTAGGSFAAPDHEYPSYLELRLTATDSDSNTDTKTLQLDPQTSTVTVHTSPAGMDVVVGEESGTSPLQHEAIVGSSNTISAPSPQAFNNRSYAFYSWSDGQSQTHTLAAPATDTTYTASYAPITPGTQTLTFSAAADAYVEEANPSTNFGAATFLRTDAGGNPDTDSYLRFQLAGHAGQDHERQAAAVRDQQHRRRARRDADLELVDGDRHHVGQQAGGDRRRGVRRPGGRDRVLGGVGRHPARHRPRAGQPPVAPGRQRRRELPLARVR